MRETACRADTVGEPENPQEESDRDRWDIHVQAHQQRAQLMTITINFHLHPAAMPFLVGLACWLVQRL